MTLRVSLLGEQSIAEVETGTVRSRSSRTVALLAFLVTHAGAPQPRQHIAGLFWPDSTDAQALTNLRRELHQLRHALGDEPSVVVTSKDLCWCDTETCSVDVRNFDLERDAAERAAADGDTAGVLAHAARAVSEYRGDLLPGEYADWLLDARSELERQCVDLCDLLCRTRARTGDLAGAAQTARRRIQLQPLEEIGYRTLMQLQADVGDRAGAVSTYHHCASVLERELGLDPDPETTRTLQVLLTRLPEATTQTPPPRPATGRSGLAVAALVGRDQEFEQLQGLWRTAAAGRPTVAVVHGVAGVGKTRLVSEVADVALQQGAVVAATQCFGVSGRLALAPVADWLRNPAVQSAAAGLDPIWRVEVDRLVPSTVTPGEPGVGPRGMVDAWQRHRFFEGMARALIAVRRPMLLVLDNLQWCDQETLAFLTLYLGLVPDAPVMVAATLRDTLDEAPDVAAWTARIRASGRLAELSLGPLDLADTRRLAEAITGGPLPESGSQDLQAMTGGFPLYVVEAARTTADLGSASVLAADLTEVLRNRFGQVTPLVRDVAGLAAAVGQNFALDLLTEASDLDADSVVRAVDELWRRRILREFRDGYDFSHDLLRDAAYAQVTPPKRWLLHRRLAQGLELLHADDVDSVSAQLAEQFARGGRPERAVSYYRRAAEVASRRFAHAEAIRLHEEALSIVVTLPEGRDRDRQELEILEAVAAPLNARFGYSYPRLQATLVRTLELAESLDRHDSVLVGLIGLWSTQFVQGNLDDGQRTVMRALRVGESDSELRGAAHFAYAGLAISLGRPMEALSHFDLAATLTVGAPSLSIGTPPDIHGQAWSAHAHWLLGHDAEARCNAREATELARTSTHPYSLAVALAYSGITLQMCGDLPALTNTVAELRELCDRYGFGYYREWGLILAGWSAGGESGVTLAQEGIGNLRSDGSFTRMPYWLALLADLLERDGRREAARATLDAALVDGHARHDVWWLPEVMRMRAAYDDEPAAVTRLHAACDMARAHGSVALLRRCERDLSERGVPGPLDAVLTAR